MGRIVNERTLQELALTIDRWIYRASQPVNFVEVESAIELLYGFLGKKKPTVLLAKSPLSAIFTAVGLELLDDCAGEIHPELHKNNFRSLFSGASKSDCFVALDRVLTQTLRNTVLSSVAERGFLSLGFESLFPIRVSGTIDNLKESLRTFLYGALDDATKNQFSGLLNETLLKPMMVQVPEILEPELAKVVAQVKNNKPKSAFNLAVERNNRNLIRLYLSTYWGAYFEFAKNCLGVSFDKTPYLIFQNLIRHIPYLLPYERVAIVSQKPVFKWKETSENWKGVSIYPSLPFSIAVITRTLSSNGVPAIQFPDGFSVWLKNDQIQQCQ